MHGCLRPALLVTLLLAALAVPASAGAAGFTVGSTGDQPDATPGNGVCAAAGGACTLRAAIEEANGLLGADTITVPAGTYATASPLNVTGANLTLDAPAGPRATVLDGPAGGAALNFNGAGAATVRGLAVTGAGLGVNVSATELTLDQVVIRDNQITIGNVNGVGLFLAAGAKVTMTRSAIVHNSGTASVNGVGSGVYVAAGATFSAVASTIAENTITSTGGSAFGGGILSFGTVTLTHVTLAGNAASGTSGSYGGNLNVASPGTVTFTDSIVTGGKGLPANCTGNGTIATAGRNIDSGTTCAFGPGQLSNTDPQLDVLGDAGGPTDSLAPRLQSPARDAAAACPAGGLDQRGAPAPAGSACDIGADESSADLAVTAQASRSDAPSGADVTYIVRVTNRGPDAAPAATLDATVGGATAIGLAAASTGSCTTTVHCDLGTLARGASATVTIVARAGSSGQAFRAQVAHGLPDGAPADDVATLALPGAAAPADTTAPALGPLKLSGRARSGRATTLRATLSEAATVRLTVDRLLSGRRSGNRCTTTTRRGKPCTVARRSGTATISAGAGTASLKLPATFSRRALGPGRYAISAVATDGAGNRSAPRTLTITVTR